MTPTLRLSDDLSLPIDFVTKTCAILAQRRKGKTYTAAVLAEELVDAGQPWVALDPTGAWWGLRADADAVNPGLPVTIFGGAHGDAPLDRTDGKNFAELVVDEPGWYIVDFSLFESNAAEVQFATEFGQRLYRRKGQPNSDFPMHLFVDEADRFVPQKPSREKGEGSVTNMLGAYEAIVRRGGLRGLGTTLISQRSAVVNKNVLEQADLFIILRTVGPNDRQRILDIVSAEGTKEQIDELKGSVASLDLGEAWVWEPGEGLFARTQVRQRRTFNSSATPRPGEKRVDPRQLAAVDLEAIKDRWSAQIEKAKADDPEELRKEITALRRQVRDLEKRKPEPAEPIEVQVEVEVPVFYVPDGVREQLTIAQQSAEGIAQGIAGALVEIQETATQVRPGGVTPARSAARPAPTARKTAPPAAVPAPSRPTRAAPPVDVDLGDVQLGLAARRILQVLDASPAGGRSKTQVALLANYHARAKGFTNALGQLRSLGFLDHGEPLQLTPAGEGVARGLPAEVIPTGPALLEYWKAQPKIGRAAGLVLDTLAEVFPERITKDELAERCDYHPRAKGFTNALGQLRGLGLITREGDLGLTDDFGEAAT